jgi:DnaJ-class molecular chaperone
MVDLEKDDTHVESFNTGLKNLEKNLSPDEQTRISEIDARLKELENAFKAMEDALHKKLYDFHDNAPNFARSEIVMKPSLGDSVKTKRFKEIITSIKEAIKNGNAIDQQSKQLKEMYASLFSHLKACIQFSKCNDKTTKSLPNPEQP